MLAATQGITPRRPGDQVFVLTGTSGGFLAAGQTGAPGRPDVATWTSRGGAAWIPAPVSAMGDHGTH